MENYLGLSENNFDPPEFTPGPAAEYFGAERRHKLRIYLPFPAKVRGVDRSGQRFETDTVLDNISGGGLYLKLRRRVEPGTSLFVLTRLSTSSERGLLVAIHGLVLRAEPQPGGECGAAVAIMHRRFF